MKNQFHISVNGIDQKIDNELPELTIGDFLRDLRSKYSTDSSCIASIKVDGDELSESSEAALALLPLSDTRKIEIFTAHPRELAEETIQNLIEFTNHIITLSHAAGNLFKEGKHPSFELAKLFDGIHIFTDALEGAKEILRASDLNAVKILEMDLLSIMEDLLDSYHKNNRPYLNDLLAQHLPTNMADWRDQGLPALLRSRDS